MLWVTALLEAINDDAHTGMAASKIVQYESPGTIDKAGHILYLDGQNRGRGTGEVDRGQYDGPLELGWPDGCAAMYRKAMFDDVGAFDEDGAKQDDKGFAWHILGEVSDEVGPGDAEGNRTLAKAEE